MAECRGGNPQGRGLFGQKHCRGRSLCRAGQLLAYDQARKDGRYDLPNRNAASYAVTWDPQRKVVWVGTMNANTIYQFNPRTKGWIQYPMPRDGARFRMLTLDGDGNVWGTYTFPGRLARPTMMMKLEPGDPDV